MQKIWSNFDHKNISFVILIVDIKIQSIQSIICYQNINILISSLDNIQKP